MINEIFVYKKIYKLKNEDNILRKLNDLGKWPSIIKYFFKRSILKGRVSVEKTNSSENIIEEFKFKDLFEITNLSVDQKQNFPKFNAVQVVKFNGGEMYSENKTGEEYEDISFIFDEEDLKYKFEGDKGKDIDELKVKINLFIKKLKKEERKNLFIFAEKFERFSKMIEEIILEDRTYFYNNCGFDTGYFELVGGKDGFGKYIEYLDLDYFSVGNNGVSFLKDICLVLFFCEYFQHKSIDNGIFNYKKLCAGTDNFVIPFLSLIERRFEYHFKFIMGLMLKLQQEENLANRYEDKKINSNDITGLVLNLNKDERVNVFSDSHGDCNFFKYFIKNGNNTEKKQRFLFLGDMVDCDLIRFNNCLFGIFSSINFLCMYFNVFKNFYFISGNHEEPDYRIEQVNWSKNFNRKKIKNLKFQFPKGFALNLGLSLYKEHCYENYNNIFKTIPTLCILKYKDVVENVLAMHTVYVGGIDIDKIVKKYVQFDEKYFITKKFSSFFVITSR